MPATTTPGSDPDVIAAVAAAAAPLLTGAMWLDLASPTAVRDALADRAQARPAAVAETAGPDAVDVLRAAAASAGDDDVVLTCLQVLDGLDDPAPAIEALLALGDGATVVASVADPAPGAWGANPAEELRRLAPADARTWRVVALRGAVVVPGDAAADVPPPPGPLAVPADAPAVAHLVVFGPRAGRLAGAPAALDVADPAQERGARRALVAELDVLRARVGSA